MRKLVAHLVGADQLQNLPGDAGRDRPAAQGTPGDAFGQQPDGQPEQADVEQRREAIEAIFQPSPYEAPKVPSPERIVVPTAPPPRTRSKSNARARCRTKSGRLRKGIAQR